MPSRLRRDRGSALLVSIILMLVLAIVGLALVNRTTAEMEAVGAKRHHDLSVGCADAARQLLYSQFRLFGKAPQTLSLQQVVGDRTLLTGHYDVTTKITSVQPLAQGNQVVSIRDIANRNTSAATGGAPYRMSVVCSDKNQPSRQVEIEFLLSFGI